MKAPAFLKDLNVQQQKAVTTTEGRVRVIAGAGTGKTKALTYRYAYLVNFLGIDPANILCLTFTNKAAAQMRRRISLMVQSGDYNDYVCTIHGWCVKFLRQEIYRLGYPKSFTILDEEDSKAMAKECMDELGMERTEKTVRKFLSEIAAQKALNGYIETYMLPSSHLTPEMRASSPIACYLARQIKATALDFDDLMNFTLYILDKYEDARSKWQEELNYIMVDEAQDCNTDDWNLIEKISAFHNNLFVVGDPDQCIYEWRGAKPSKFVSFPSDTDIILDENYRSTQGILDIANCIISNNVNRIPKDLFTLKARGMNVIHFHGKSEDEEMEWITSTIVRQIAAGASAGDFAVLFRSSYQSRAVEHALMDKRLPYAVWGGTRFFERKEIKDILSYVRLVVNSDDDLSFRRIINVPSRKLGRVFLDNLTHMAEADGTSLLSALMNHEGELGKKEVGAFISIIREARNKVADGISISDLTDYLLSTSGLRQMVREDQDEDRLENVEELLHSMEHYEEEHSGEEPTIEEYLQDIALYTNTEKRKADGDVIKLMTIHQAKGLEFPFVFVTGLTEGIFPNMRTIRENKKVGEEEERRLMYVAVTRAEKGLYLTESEGYNTSTKTGKYPSRFLKEIKDSIIVREGYLSKDLWESSDRLRHVLDEENFVPQIPGMMMAAGMGGIPGPAPEDDGLFKEGDRVSHEIFGEGTVESFSKDHTTYKVRFGDGFLRNIRAPFLVPVKSS